MYLYIDIETVASSNQELAEFLAGTVKAPSNYKDAEKIAEYVADAKKTILDKTVFDGAFGQIVSISWAFGDGVVNTLTRQKNSEKEILEQFMSSVIDNTFYTVVGFNHVAFDLPFIVKRCIVLGVVGLAGSLPVSPKPWDDNVFDIMVKWDAKNPISLSKLAYALGIESDNKYTGADVADMVALGEWDELERYNADDVRLSREIHKRMTAVLGL
jgi:DNA polymerase elongation subunit (family B)